MECISFYPTADTGFIKKTVAKVKDMDSICDCQDEGTSLV